MFQCSVTCEGGTQTRFVICLDHNRMPDPNECDISEKLESVQECNTQSCDSQFYRCRSVIFFS